MVSQTSSKAPQCLILSATVRWRDQLVPGRSWSTAFHAHCLRSAQPPAPPFAPARPQTLDLSQVPAEYHDLVVVFSKEDALSLPLHRPYDCAIELIPGPTLPKSRLYNLLKPEQQAMESYVHDFLDVGIIRPSSSPVGRGFSSWGRKLVLSVRVLISEVLYLSIWMTF